MAPRNRDAGKRLALSCVVAQATSTTTAVIDIPTGCHEIVIVGATVKHYIKTGTDNALDLAATNAAVLQVGGSGEVLYPAHDHLYLLVEAVSSTGTVDVSFYS